MTSTIQKATDVSLQDNYSEIEAFGKKQIRLFWQKIFCQRAAIFKSVLSNPVLACLDFAGLEQTIGESTIRVEKWVSEDKSGKSFFADTEISNIPFTSFIQRIKEGENIYMAMQNLSSLAIANIEQMIADDFCVLGDCSLNVRDTTCGTNIWAGPAETFTPIHYDKPHNFLFQAEGRKLVFVYHPDECENLYIPSEEMEKKTWSPVSPLEPNLEKHRKFKDVKGFYAILEPGDVIYIPKRWPHFVVSLSESVSVNFFWISKDEASKRPQEFWNNSKRREMGLEPN